MFIFSLFLGASVLRDLMDGRGETSDRFGWGMNTNVSRPGLGVRGPTSSMRYPLPRPWERMPPMGAQTVPAHPHARFGDAYGVLTGAGGIRGVPTFTSFTPAQIAAYNRDGAAQGLRGSSVAPPG